MSRQDRHIRICKILIVLNLCFIWGNSLMPAEISQAFSDWVKALLQPLFFGGGSGTEGSGILRKIAHFTEFAALGLLLRWQFLLLEKKGRQSLLWGVLAAGIDETIQFFVPGRSPGLRDVFIDSCGVLTGILLLKTGYALLKRNQRIRYGGK